VAHLGAETGRFRLAQSRLESLLERSGALGGASKSGPELLLGGRAAESVSSPRWRLTVNVLQFGAAAADGGTGAGDQAD